MPDEPKIRWTQPELDVVFSWFNTNKSLWQTYQQLHALNPSRSMESLGRKIRHMERAGWKRRRDMAREKLRIGYLDIEATQLNANFGFMLCWCIKPEMRKEIEHGEITKKEIFDGKRDQRVVKELLLAMRGYDLLYAHYGIRFDFPFIRTRMLIHGLEKLKPVVMVGDTWVTARKKLKLHSNRLDAIGEAFDCGVEKTPLKPRHWQEGQFGDPKALEYILHHCKNDVLLLEAVRKKMQPFEAVTMSMF